MYPKQLHIKSSADHSSVAVSSGHHLLGETISSEPRTHMSDLAPMVSDLLKSHDISTTALRSISIDSGPGSYTGLRVGFALTKGLSFSHKIPLIAIRNADILMHIARQDISDQERCHVVIHARKEDYLVYNYDFRGREYVFRNQKQVEGIIALTNLGGTILTTQEINGIKSTLIPRPTAKNLISLAYDRLQKGDFTPRSEFSPIYFKPPYITTPNRKLI